MFHPVEVLLCTNQVLRDVFISEHEGPQQKEKVKNPNRSNRHRRVCIMQTRRVYLIQN